MRTNLLLAIFIGALLFSNAANACKFVKGDSWYFDDDQLIEKTATIIIAKTVQKIRAKRVPKNDWEHAEVINYGFEVNEVIKGTFSDKAYDFNGSVESGGDGISYGSDCATRANFKIGDDYLIFVDNLNRRAFLNMKDRGAKMLELVKTKLAADKKKAK